MSHIVSEDGYIVDVEAELASELVTAPDAGEPIQTQADSIQPVVTAAPTPALIRGLRGEPGPPGPPGLPGGSVEVVVAGEAIGGHRAVVLGADSKGFYADHTNPEHIGRVHGITLNAANLDGELTVARNGLVTELSWNWTPLMPVFLGANGLLTQTRPATGFAQVLGVPPTAVTLYIHIREPIQLT